VIALRLSIIFLRLKILPVLSVRSFDKLSPLKSYYFNLGYLDFKVTDAKSDLSKDKQSIDVAIQIDEGSKYKVGKIEFTGNILLLSISTSLVILIP
jgi:outer membrane protein assembly factor BamA